MTPQHSNDATLALDAMQEELLWLQQLAEHEEHAALRAPLTRLDSHCDHLRHGISDGVLMMDSCADALQCVIMLLDHAEQHALPASHLSALLAPLQQQMRRSSMDMALML